MDSLSSCTVCDETVMKNSNKICQAIKRQTTKLQKGPKLGQYQYLKYMQQKPSSQAFMLQPIEILPFNEITNHMEIEKYDHITIQRHKSQQNKDILQAHRLIGCSELHLRDRADHSNSHWWVPMFTVGKTMQILAWEWMEVTSVLKKC